MRRAALNAIVVSVLSAEALAASAALDTKSVRAFLTQEMTTGIGSTPEELDAHLKREIARYGEVMRKGNITVEQ